MKSIINKLLSISWQSNWGTTLKYKLKKANFQCKPLGWSVTLFSTKDSFLLKKWKKKSFLSWFEIHPEYNVSGVADPFLCRFDGAVYVFFEAIVSQKGEIWCAKIVKDMITEPRKVLSTPYHLSYPNVFIHEGAFYMLPESSQSGKVALYKAVNFPVDWELRTILKDEVQFVDTNLLIKDGVFYWFTYDLVSKQSRLFFSYSLEEIWNEHPQSPFISDRNAGDFMIQSDKIIRPVQFSNQSYGQGVDLKEIVQLSPAQFLEKDFKTPFLRPKNGFCLHGIHHISILAHKKGKLIALDGKNNNYYKVLK